MQGAGGRGHERVHQSWPARFTEKPCVRAVTLIIIIGEPEATGVPESHARSSDRWDIWKGNYFTIAGTQDGPGWEEGAGITSVRNKTAIRRSTRWRV